MIKYNTKEECQKAIDTVKAMGMEPAQWMLDQLNAFNEKANVLREIYPHLCRELGYSSELQQCVQETVNKLTCPVGGHNAKEPGLLLGKIQSGKTRAFVGVIAKLFDEGIDVAIVLEKGTRALTEQTISRMEKDFGDFLKRGIIGQPVVEVHDILTIRNGLSPRELKDKNIIVCKKEKNNMSILNDILTKNGFSGKNIVIIDDEADFASRNYKVKSGNVDLAVIANQIDAMVARLKHCYYLQVTATPYSLYLQQDGYIDLGNGGKALPFKPRFTVLLPIYSEYIGGEHYFDLSQNPNSMYSYLHQLVREECREAITRVDRRYVKNVSNSPKLLELRKAILGYFTASSIRRIQERKNGFDYQTSCVIHVEIAKAKQQYEAELVNELIDNWKEELRNAKGNIPRSLQSLFDSLYTNYEESIKLGIDEGLLSGGVIPAKTDVWVELAGLMLNDEYIVNVVNSDNDVNALLDREGQLKLTHPVNIFVGGQILDRGITIANLICFFYGRNPQRLQQDTVLQHARMYGNRSKKDMSVTRFYTTQRLYDNLQQIHFLDEQLRNWLTEYSKNADYDPSLSVVFKGSQSIIPCSPGKLALSDCISLKPYKRMLPYGFQTGSKTAIQNKIEKIDQLITTSPNYGKKDMDGFFEIEVKLVEKIIALIRETYIYDRTIDNNKGLDWNENEMLTAIQYATTNTNGKLWCLHRTNRNMSRLRTDGSGFIDAPDDGRTDLMPSKAKAIDKPVIMLFRENGAEDNGWRGTAFYWPLFLTHGNLIPVVFTAVRPK